MKILQPLPTAFLSFALLLLFTGEIVAQRPDSLLANGRALIKKEKFDQAIPILLTGLRISRQTAKDSLTGAHYYALGLAYRYKTRYDSALYYLGQSGKIASANGYTTLQAATQLEYYAIYNRIGRSDSAIAVINRLKTLVPALDSNSNEAAKIEMYLGHDAKHKAKYSEALGHYHKALRLFIRQKDSVNEGNIYISLANVMVYLAQKDKALAYHRQAANLFQQIGRHTELLNELLNITDMYYTTGNLDSAESAARKALPIAEALDDKTSLAYSYINLGNISKRRKKFPEAQTYLSRAARIGEMTGNQNALIAAYQSIAEMYMAQKQPAKAQPYLEKHFALAKKMNSTEEITEAVWNLSENANALHQYEKAYQYQKLYSTYRDSSFYQSSARSFTEMEAKYQAEKKEEEILLLKKDQQLDRLTLQKQKNFQQGAVIGLLLLLLIAFLVVNRYRILHRTKGLIELEKMRNNIARDLHDDIGSNLTSINILSKLSLQEETAGHSQMLDNMHKIKNRSAAIMDSMGDLVWTISPDNDTLEQMVLRMNEFTTEILEPLDIGYTFHKEGNLSVVKLDIKQRKDLYLLFKEAVNNAAKYSRCRHLSIELRQDRQYLRMKITDDGTGFNEQLVKNGNGLRNMRARAANLGSGLSIDTAIGKGTTIGIEVPMV
ncbi:MAG TPA: tetratricopeptide repeat protein [Puia sp.]|jgi:signal transduction histidine kinase